MNRDWKPGDVAMVDYGFGEERMMRDHRGWMSPTTEVSDSDQRVESARPLVVIDPDDKEAVERLARAWHEQEHFSPGQIAMTAGAYRMQAALREFANPTPPKPEEPTGLGAVVEDANGRRYIRSERHEQAPWDRFGEYVGGFLWSDIATVRVLSEGVQP